MQNENHYNVGSLFGLHVEEVIPKKKQASAVGASQDILLIYLKCYNLINNFWIIYVVTVNVALAKLASDLKFTLANRKFVSSVISTPEGDIYFKDLVRHNSVAVP